MGLTQDYLNRLIDLYVQVLAPSKWTRKGKVLGIGDAIMLFFAYKIKRVIKPPKALAHIPHVNYFTFIRNLFSDSVRIRTQQYALPQVTSKESNGVFLHLASLSPEFSLANIWNTYKKHYSNKEVPGVHGWTIHVTDPEALKRVFYRTDIFPKDRTPVMSAYSLSHKFLGRPSILNVNGQEWKSQRKVANPAFHRSMPIQLFANLTKTLLNEMEKLNTDRIDISDLMERFTLDAIGKASFDFDFNTLGDKDNHWVKNNCFISITIYDLE